MNKYSDEKLYAVMTVCTRPVIKTEYADCNDLVNTPKVSLHVPDCGLWA